jgi:enoyl-CoA hydratase/carnithine racemase
MSYTELDPLVDLVGVSGTLEVLLEGGLLDAERAYHKGFVNRVVPDEDIAEAARATAHRIAAGAPLVNRWHKKFVRRLADGEGPPTEEERREAYEAFETDDYREGVEAFLERRDPRFEGK